MMTAHFFKAILAAGSIFLSMVVQAHPPVRFVVDAAESAMEWTGKKVTGKHFGWVRGISGEMTVEGTRLLQGSFEIDLNTITVEDIKDAGSNAKLLGHLKSDDFFSVDKYPKARFVISAATLRQGNTYLVKGKLTIKGITQEIEFPAEIGLVGGAMRATAKIKVDRTKFDIRYRSNNFFQNLGDKAIYDDFELDLKLVARAD